MDMTMKEQDFLACCGSSKFAAEMAKVDIPGWLEAFSAHPQIGDVESLNNRKETTTEWSKGEQSAALSTATDSTLKELAEWNWQYKGKFGFTFLICASGRSTPEILDALKKRFTNRPIVELEIAAGEQQKITESRLAKLFDEKCNKVDSGSNDVTPLQSTGSLIADRRLNQIGAHLNSSVVSLEHSPLDSSARTRPPITTHVLDISQGKPGAGIEVLLESWNGPTVAPGACLGLRENVDWTILGSSVTNDDGRCGSLMPIVDQVPAGIYRITFNTGKYYLKMGADMPGNKLRSGFYPYISIVFEIKPYCKMAISNLIVSLLEPFSFLS